MHKKNSLILFVSILISGTVLFLIYNGNQNVSKLNTKFAKASISIADDPYGRIEFERRMLIDPATGKIPENIRQKELKFASTLPKVENIGLAKSKGINTLTWSQRGPINRGGRTRALGIDVRTQTAPNITIIAGGVSGGIWKSTNNGSTWTNKLHADSIHSITCIAQDTRTGQENTWYVGTGEAQGSAGGGGSAFFRGDGIYKSTDNGDTWTLLSSTSTGSVQSFNTQWRYVNNIAVNKTTGSVFAAATNAVYKSSNGGTIWTTVRSSLASSAMSDVQITSTGVIYATIPSGFSQSGIWRSTDDGATWTSITPAGFPFVYGRNVFAIAPSNENIVYFWVYTNAGITKTELWKYDAAGPTWTNLTSNLPTNSGSVDGTNVQGSYNMVLKVKPDDASFILIGGTNLYRTTDGFSTVVNSTGATNWIGGYAIANNISQYTNQHPDQHALVFLNSNPEILYAGSDGGVHLTTDVTASNVTWAELNTGYVTSQFYAIGIDPTTSGDPVIAGGMQDNGNYITFSNDFNTNWVDWNHGGDGAFAAVRKTGSNEYTIYIEAQEGWLWRQKYNANGTLTDDVLIQPSISGTFAFVNPFMLDPNDNSIMYFANVSSVLRSTNVDETTPIWSDLTNATPGGSVSALAVSKSPTANILYVGGSTGKILKITGANTGNPTATDISTGLPSGYVSCLWVQSDDQDNIIAVFSNYSVKSVWFSGNGGTSWSDISGNLEANSDGSGNGPSCRWVTTVTVGGTKTYYIATSTGLYSTSTLNGTSTVWAQEGSTTIGNVVSVMVKSRDSDGLVVVGTHGAGIYSANTNNTTTLSVTPTIRNVNSSSGNTTFSITSNISWSVSDNVSWLSVSPTNGNGNGSITANYQENTSTSNSRTATITVTGGGLTRQVTIVQDKKTNGTSPSISILPPTQNANGSTGTIIPIQIKVGDPNQVLSPNDFLGVSFNLNWDNAQYIEYSGSSTPGAFLGNNPITIVQAFSDHFEAGLTRTTGGTTGSGIVLSCTLRVKTNAPGGTIITLSFSNIVATKSDGTSLTLQPAGNSTIIISSYSISILPPTQNANGSTGTIIPIQIKVGDPNQIQSPDDFLGVSFNLNWDNSQYIEYSGSSTPGAFLGNNPITIVQAFTDHIEAGLTRTTGGTTGSGIVLSCSLRVKADAPDSTVITLSLSNITAIKNDGSALVLSPVGNSTITLNSGLTVWPGDTNNDGIVNATDVLYLGLYYNKTGPARINPSLNWVGQSCPPWSPEAATYADCNGNGTVNAADILGIGLNYNKSHTTSHIKAPTSINKVNTTGSISMFSVNGNSFTADTAGSEFEIDIKVGDPDAVTSFLGASFNLTWSDTTLIEGVSTTAGSLLGSNPIVIGQNFIDHIEVGVTSTSGGYNGSGIIAKLILKIKKPIPVSTNIDFNLTNITALDATGGSIDLTQTNNPLTIGIVTDIANETIPTSYSLSQNYPNPFNPSTTIRYTIPKQSFVTLKIYNVLGEEVKTLVSKELNIGVYEVNFDASNLASGIYFYSLKAGDFVSSKKLILMK